MLAPPRQYENIHRCVCIPDLPAYNTADGKQLGRLADNRHAFSGADDYLVKPFYEAELLARIDALARRAARAFMPAVEVGRLHIDLAARAARYDTALLDLSSTEFRLLELLARNAGRTFARSTLLERIWGYDFDGVSNVVDVYVSHLRKKLRRAGSANQMIQTAWGVGYKLQAS